MFGNIAQTNAENARYCRKLESFSSNSMSIFLENNCVEMNDLDQFKHNFEEVKANIQSELKTLKKSVAKLYDASPEDSNNTRQLQEVELDLLGKKKNLEHCMKQILDIESENLKIRKEIQLVQTSSQEENQCMCLTF